MSFLFKVANICFILYPLTEFESLPGDGLQQVNPLWQLHLARPVMLQSVNWSRVV